jgi:hypothetical protein
VNFDVPLAPTVVEGLPLHFWMVPAMPPQMERMATFVSCEFRPDTEGLQTVLETASGFNGVFARRGWEIGLAEVRSDRERESVMRVVVGGSMVVRRGEMVRW